MADKYTDEELKARFEFREKGLVSYLSGARRHEILFEPYHVSATEYRVLSVLLFTPGGCEPSVIADRLNVLRQTMTKVIDSLVARGLAVRSEHPTDRRRVYIRLLPEGTTLARTLLTLETDYNAAVRMHFAPGEIELYRELQQKMNTARDIELQCILDARATDGQQH